MWQSSNGGSSDNILGRCYLRGHLVTAQRFSYISQKFSDVSPNIRLLHFAVERYTSIGFGELVRIRATASFALIMALLQASGSLRCFAMCNVSMFYVLNSINPICIAQIHTIASRNFTQVLKTTNTPWAKEEKKYVEKLQAEPSSG